MLGWLRRLHRHEWALDESVITGFLCLMCGKKRLARDIYELDHWFFVHHVRAIIERAR